MLDMIQSKAGLIGFLQGSIKGTLATVKSVVDYQDNTKEELEHYLKATINQLEKLLVESDEAWERVKLH